MRKRPTASSTSDVSNSGNTCWQHMFTANIGVHHTAVRRWGLALGQCFTRACASRRAHPLALFNMQPRAACLPPVLPRHSTVGISKTHTPPANTHTHRTSTQHTHKKHRPSFSLWVGITIRYRRPLRCRALDCPGSAAGVERRAEHARILTADDSRDVALVAEPVVDDGPA